MRDYDVGYYGDAADQFFIIDGQKLMRQVDLQHRIVIWYDVTEDGYIGIKDEVRMRTLEEVFEGFQDEVDDEPDTTFNIPGEQHGPHH